MSPLISNIAQIQENDADLISKATNKANTASFSALEDELVGIDEIKRQIFSRVFRSLQGGGSNQRYQRLRHCSGNGSKKTSTKQKN